MFDATLLVGLIIPNITCSLWGQGVHTHAHQHTTQALPHTHIFACYLMLSLSDVKRACRQYSNPLSAAYMPLLSLSSSSRHTHANIHTICIEWVWNTNCLAAAEQMLLGDETGRLWSNLEHVMCQSHIYPSLPETCLDLLLPHTHTHPQTSTHIHMAFCRIIMISLSSGSV